MNEIIKRKSIEDIFNLKIKMLNQLKELEELTNKIDKTFDELYGKMAGVINKKIKPISKPKGLPDDITLITKIDFEQYIYHHASWFNIQEIKQLEKWFNKRADDTKYTFEWYPGASFFLYLEQMTGYLFGDSFNKTVHTFIEDIRFIFWFDN